MHGLGMQRGDFVRAVHVSGAVVRMYPLASYYARMYATRRACTAHMHHTTHSTSHAVPRASVPRRNARLRHNIIEESRAKPFAVSLHRANKIRALGKKAEMSGHTPFSKYTIAVIIN